MWAGSASDPGGAKERADGVGDGHRDDAACDVTDDGWAYRGVAEKGTDPTACDERDEHGHDGDSQAPAVGWQHDGEQRQQGAGREGDEARPGGVPGVGEFVRVDAELDTGVGAQGVAGGELLGDLMGEFVGDALFFEQAGEFGEFGLGVAASSSRSTARAACSESR